MLKVVKTTVTGGLVFLLPLAVLAYLLGKIIATARQIVEPISDKLPVSSVAGVSATFIVAVLAIIAVSFLAGLFAKTSIAQQAVKGIETHLLGRIPAYGLLKSLGNEIASPEQDSGHPVVLVRFDDAWQVGVRVSTSRETGHTVVFLPDSPTPQSGTVMIVEAARIQDTDIPLRKAFTALAVRGTGLDELLKGQPYPAAAVQAG